MRRYMRIEASKAVFKTPMTSITTKHPKTRKKDTAVSREFQEWLENMLEEDAGIIKALAER